MHPKVDEVLKLINEIAEDDTCDMEIKVESLEEISLQVGNAQDTLTEYEEPEE